jgi:molybdopterin converting factor small subunit
MEYTLNFYGPLSELFGAHGRIVLAEGSTVSTLRVALEQAFEGLSDYPYTLAQDGAFKSDHELLSSGAIEVFPPFSGG